MTYPIVNLILVLKVVALNKAVIPYQLCLSTQNKHNFLQNFAHTIYAHAPHIHTCTQVQAEAYISVCVYILIFRRQKPDYVGLHAQECC